MKVLIFGVFSQLLDMLTTVYGLSLGNLESNIYLGPRPLYVTVVAVKLAAIILIGLCYLLTKYYKKSPLTFNIPMGLAAVWTFFVGMSNLSQQVV